MNRRTMLARAAGVGLGLAAGGTIARAQAGARPLPDPSPQKLPRWRGFNLLEMFIVPSPDQAKRFRAEDFAWIGEWGFNFVRLPLDYRSWTDPGDWTNIREDRVAYVAEAVDFGRKYGIHVQLNFHRAPGYTVASPPERKNLWEDSDAQRVAALHWSTFAKRFRGIPSRELSFDLFNEPARVGPEAYRKVVGLMAEAIHEEDPNRLVIADGREYGNKPPTELVGLGVASATRGYAPFHLTHYKASWVEGSDRWPKPTYPLKEGNSTWDKSNLERDQIKPWKALEAQGVGVMVGEFGAHNRTPHDVVLPWMRDCLAAWKLANWGWALWNFRGSFGVLDSDRQDVTYEDWHGHKLDRAMLDLLRSA
jgi:endoglucanase